MHILITNTASLNVGDAAILCAMVDLARTNLGPQTQIAVYDSQSDIAACYYTDICFRPALHAQLADWARPGLRLKAAAALLLLAALLNRSRVGGVLRRRLPTRLQASLEEYATAQLVISSGGTYLVPDYRLGPKIYDYLVTLALRRPLIFFTQSLGPFHGRATRLVLRYIFCRARLILVRDERSWRHLAELGVPPERIRISADAAFALRSPQLPKSPPPQQRPLRVAVSVRDWPHFHGRSAHEGMERFLDSVAAMVEHAVRRCGAEVVFLSTCQGIPEYWTDDAKTAEQAWARLSATIKPKVSIDRQFRRPDELIRRFADFDLVVGTRMHACILSLCAGVPVLPIGYEFKTKELADRLGLGEYVQDIEGVSPDGLVRTFQQFVDRRAAIAADLWPRLARERASAESAGTFLRDALIGP